LPEVLISNTLSLLWSFEGARVGRRGQTEVRAPEEVEKFRR
jgi:hypothetical protein